MGRGEPMPLTWREENDRRLWSGDPAYRPQGGYLGGVRFFIIYRTNVGPDERRFVMTSPLLKRPRDPGWTATWRATEEELKAMAEETIQDWLRRAQLEQREVPVCP